MNAFLVSARIAWRTLPESLNWKTAAVRLLGAPVFTALFYLALVSGSGIGRVTPGDAVAAALGSGSIVAAVAVATLVAGDRFDGTLPFLFLATHARATAWLGRLCVVAGLGVASSTVALVLPFVVTGGPDRLGDWGALVIVLLCSAPATMGIGWVLGAVSLSLRDALAPANLAEYVLPLLCGVVVSTTMMPSAVAWVARGFPLTHVLEAGRVGIAEGLTASFWNHLGAGLITGLVWVVLGRFAWAVFVRRVRRTGTFDGLSAG